MEHCLEQDVARAATPHHVPASISEDCVPAGVPGLGREAEQCLSSEQRTDERRDGSTGDEETGIDSSLESMRGHPNRPHERVHSSQHPGAAEADSSSQTTDMMTEVHSARQSAVPEGDPAAETQGGGPSDETEWAADADQKIAEPAAAHGESGENAKDEECEEESVEDRMDFLTQHRAKLAAIQAAALVSFTVYIMLRTCERVC